MASLLKVSLISVIIIEVLALMSVSAPGIHYVKPDNASISSCPDQPCLTLDQYVQHSPVYFTTGSTFVFVPGNHSLQSSIWLNDISNITLMGTGYNSSTTIICALEYTIFTESVSNLYIEWLRFDLTENQYLATALKIYNSRGVMISDCTFQGSGNTTRTEARALDATESSITILRSWFEGNTGAAGGAIYASYDCLLVLSDNTFIGNIAWHLGGAIYFHIGSIALFTSHNEFSHNDAGYGGGAMYCDRCNISIAGYNIYESNHLLHQGNGGAIYMWNGHLTTSGTLFFSKNMATEGEGGAICAEDSEFLLGGQAITFSHNVAKRGGGMNLWGTSLRTNATSLTFSGNYAKTLGGGLRIGTSFASDSVLLTSATFTHNRAECGGAIFVTNEETTVFTNFKITENSGSAVCISESILNFTGNTQISRNEGKTGGGISSKNSILTFTGDTLFDANTAIEGGAINSLQGQVVFHGTTRFTHNQADSKGGAINALGSNIVLNYSTLAEFESNSAMNGGALYLSTATLTLTSLTSLCTFNNSAVNYGGAIYYKDSPTATQCNFTYNDVQESTDLSLPLPNCFLQSEDYYYGNIYSQKDSASIDGNFLYGGSLGKCRPFKKVRDNAVHTLYRFLTDHMTIDALQTSTARNISSEAYELHFCSKSQNYNRTISVEVFRAQRFSVSLLAVPQGGLSTSTLVTTITHKSRLQTLQNIQTLPEGCSDLTYNLFSAEAHDQLILYPDGPCRDSGQARVAINVTFLPCPGGFTLSGEVCICEERLHAYDVDCIIDESIQIIKKSGSNFWMGAVPTQNAGSYGGLILYESCPAEYCKTQAVALTLDNPDAQCDLNHSGVLCGQCASNYSLMLGSSRCEICSNHYLALLLAFAAAGLALVAFLTFLKLTVATGIHSTA